MVGQPRYDAEFQERIGPNGVGSKGVSGLPPLAGSSTPFRRFGIMDAWDEQNAL